MLAAAWNFSALQLSVWTLTLSPHPMLAETLQVLEAPGVPTDTTGQMQLHSCCPGILCAGEYFVSDGEVPRLMRTWLGFPGLQCGRSKGHSLSSGGTYCGGGGSE